MTNTYSLYTMSLGRNIHFTDHHEVAITMASFGYRVTLDIMDENDNCFIGAEFENGEFVWDYERA